VFDVAMVPPEQSPFFQRDLNELSELIEKAARNNHALSSKARQIANGVTKGDETVIEAPIKLKSKD